MMPYSINTGTKSLSVHQKAALGRVTLRLQSRKRFVWCGKIFSMSNLGEHLRPLHGSDGVIMYTTWCDESDFILFTCDFVRRTDQPSKKLWRISRWQLTYRGSQKSKRWKFESAQVCLGAGEEDRKKLEDSLLPFRTPNYNFLSPREFSRRSISPILSSCNSGVSPERL